MCFIHIWRRSSPVFSYESSPPIIIIYYVCENIRLLLSFNKCKVMILLNIFVLLKKCHHIIYNHSGFLTIFFFILVQGMEPPYHVIPVPKITQPLPPPKSDCQKDIESNSSMKAVSLNLVLSLLGFIAMFLWENKDTFLLTHLGFCVPSSLVKDWPP